MKFSYLLAPIAFLLVFACRFPAQADSQARPTVLELFTAKACPACPAADALTERLAQADPAIFALSYHVHYWDTERRHDKLASAENTERQRDYNDALKVDTLFTPQMIVDGAASYVGSDEAGINEGVAQARSAQSAVPVAIAPVAGEDKLRITVGDAATPLPERTEVYEIHFNNGEATGIHNVAEIIPLVLSHEYDLPLKRLFEDGVAVLVQEPEQGRIIGAAYYLKNAEN
jgi:hypothetical protein